MNVWMENLLAASRDAAVLAMMVGLLLAICGRYVPAGWRHGLWLLVAARLLMPVLPESPVSVQRVLTVEKQVRADDHEFPRMDVALVEGPTIPESSEFATAPYSGAVGPEPGELGKAVERSDARSRDIREMLFGIWVSGVVGVLALAGFFTWRFSKRLAMFSPTDQRQAELEDFLGKLGTELGFGKLPAMRITEAVDVPALYGLFRPVILMPPSALEKLSETELRLVLMHELGHWRRRDLRVNFLMVLLQAVHWFNPLVWWAFHRARIESERATDAWVLRRAGAEKAGTTVPCCYGFWIGVRSRGQFPRESWVWWKVRRI